MSTLRPIKSADVKRGMHIRCVEHYDHGATLQFDGEVDYVFRDKGGTRCAQLRGAPELPTEDRSPWRTEVYEVLG